MKTAYHIGHLGRNGLPRVFGTIFIKVDLAVPTSEVAQQCLEAVAKADSSLEVGTLIFKIVGTAELDFSSIPPDSLGHYVEWEQDGVRVPRIVVIL